jgi:transposase InsO family protein
MHLQGKLSVGRMCQLAGVSRAGFYRHLVEVAPDEEEMELRDAIQRIYLEHRRNYGYRRITIELRDHGMLVNRKRVARLMREDNLIAVSPRKYVVTTDSAHSFQVYLNLAARMQVTAVNQLWVADITYIRLLREFVFLAVILDAYSRLVVGRCLARSLHSEFAVTALKQAIEMRQPQPGLVHHSDRGVQYASGEYTGVLEAHGIIPSMSRPGNPWDKAYASYCTSCEPWTMFAGKRRRAASLTPCALRGGSGPGSSYRHMFLSFTGYAFSKPFAPHARTHSGESFKRSAISSIVSKPVSRSRS